MTVPPELGCPNHGEPMEALAFRLVCRQGCEVPVVNGIPRFVDSSLYAAAFGSQWKTHPHTQLDSRTGLTISRDRLTRCLGGSLDVVAGKSVLEVGCGAGRFTEILLGAGARVLACDLSEAIDVNAANCGGAPGYFPFQADILRLPVAHASMDVVLALGVLQHTPSPESAIAELALRVRPGGSLVFDHYTVEPRDTWYYRALGRLTPRALVREVLIRVPTSVGSPIAYGLADAFLPLHRAVWRPGQAARLVRRVLARLSPMTDHYDVLPELGLEGLAEWARLDTHDALTDRYKHLRGPKQLRAALAACGLVGVEIAYGGTGLEARARRPLQAGAGTEAQSSDRLTA
jgi:SAM-dependent methyltransferase